MLDVLCSVRTKCRGFFFGRSASTFAEMLLLLDVMYSILIGGPQGREMVE